MTTASPETEAEWRARGIVPRVPKSVALPTIPLFGGVGLALAIVGAHDVSSRVTSVAVKGLGVIWLALGVVLLVAAALEALDVRDMRKITQGSGSFLLLGCLIGAASAASFAYAEISSLDRNDNWLLLFAAVFAGFLVSFSAIRNAGARLVPAFSGLRKVALGIGLSVVLTLFITLAQASLAAYQKDIASKPTLNVTTRLERVGERRGLEAYRATVTIDNVGQTAVRVLASHYNVVGLQVSPTNTGDSVFVEALAAPYLRVEDIFQGSDPAQSQRFSREAHEENQRIIQAGKLFSDGWWFEPNETATREYVVYTSKSEYDLMRVNAEVLVARKDRLSVSLDTNPPPELFGSSVYVRWNIEEPSWIRALFEGTDRTILVEYFLGEGYVVEGLSFVRGEGRNETVDEVDPERLGVWGTHASFELALWSVPAGHSSE